MNDRLVKAISKLKKDQDKLEAEIKTLERMLEDRSSLNMQKALIAVSEDLAKYTIHNGNWYYSGKDTGIKAEGIDGKDGIQGPQGLPGKDGKNGKDGKDGKPGKDGKNGLPGRDGKDGVTPNIKIGKVETSPEYGGALAKLRPGKNNVLYLDLTLPRGPQGFAGFDGKDAKINGMNELEIVAGDNIEITQDGNKIIISATGSPVPPTPTEDTQLITSDNKIFITSNDANFIVKESD